MKVNVAPPTSARSMVATSVAHRQIIISLFKKNLAGRYRGSFLGAGWSVISPLVLFTVYFIVFSGVVAPNGFAKLGDGKSVYAISLFIGIIVHGFFAEIIAASAFTIVQNTNFVKKVVFPLETLSIVIVLVALFHVSVNVLVMLLACVALGLTLHLTVAFLPILWLPCVLIALGISWLLASLSVYFRDIAQAVGVVTMILLFASPVFYDLQTLPHNFASWLYLNPLSYPIEQTRNIVINGNAPAMIGYLAYSAAGLTICWVGYIWFQKTRQGFGSVL